jgi:alkylhydroperoxidase family enzyme
VTNRYAGLVAALRAAVFDGPGVVDPALRRAAGTGGALPEPLGAYAATVRDSSYRITDDDLAALRTAGCGEEEIFEVTIAAATGAALHRLEVGLRAMDRGA